MSKVVLRKWLRRQIMNCPAGATFSGRGPGKSVAAYAAEIERQGVQQRNRSEQAEIRKREPPWGGLTPADAKRQKELQDQHDKLMKRPRLPLAGWQWVDDVRLLEHRGFWMPGGGPGFHTGTRLYLGLLLGLIGLFISWLMNLDRTFTSVGALIGFALGFRICATLLLSMLPSPNPRFSTWDDRAHRDAQWLASYLAMPNLIQGLGENARPPRTQTYEPFGQNVLTGLVVVAFGAVLVSAGLGAVICGLAAPRSSG